MKFLIKPWNSNYKRFWIENLYQTINFNRNSVSKFQIQPKNLSKCLNKNSSKSKCPNQKSQIFDFLTKTPYKISKPQTNFLKFSTTFQKTHITGTSITRWLWSNLKRTTFPTSFSFKSNIWPMYPTTLHFGLNISKHFGKLHISVNCPAFVPNS